MAFAPPGDRPGDERPSLSVTIPSTRGPLSPGPVHPSEASHLRPMRRSLGPRSISLPSSARVPGTPLSARPSAGSATGERSSEEPPAHGVQVVVEERDRWRRTHPLTPIPFLALQLITIFMWHGVQWIFRLLHMLVFVLLLFPAFLPVFYLYLTAPRRAIRRNVVYGDQARNALDIYVPRELEHFCCTKPGDETDACSETDGCPAAAHADATAAAAHVPQSYYSCLGSACECGRAKSDSVAGPSALRPVFIFATGGVWLIGYKAWGAFLASVLASHGVVCVLPDYRNFPQASSVSAMVADVSRAVGWTCRHIHRFGGDASRITLAGQSAGAHITAMMLVAKILAEGGALDEFAEQATAAKTSSGASTASPSTPASRAPGARRASIPGPGSISSSPEVSAADTAAGLLASMDSLLTASPSTAVGLLDLRRSLRPREGDKLSSFELLSLTYLGPLIATVGAHSWSVANIRSTILVSGPFDLIAVAPEFHAHGLYRPILRMIMSAWPGDFSSTDETATAAATSFRALLNRVLGDQSPYAGFPGDAPIPAAPAKGSTPALEPHGPLKSFIPDSSLNLLAIYSPSRLLRMPVFCRAAIRVVRLAASRGCPCGEGPPSPRPVRSLGHSLPAILIQHGTNDSAVPFFSSLDMHAAMVSAGFRARLQLYDGQTHTDPLIETTSHPQSCAPDQRPVKHMVQFLYETSAVPPAEPCTICLTRSESTILLSDESVQPSLAPSSLDLGSVATEPGPLSRHPINLATDHLEDWVFDLGQETRSRAIRRPDGRRAPKNALLVPVSERAEDSLEPGSSDIDDAFELVSSTAGSDSDFLMSLPESEAHILARTGSPASVSATDESSPTLGVVDLLGSGEEAGHPGLDTADGRSRISLAQSPGFPLVETDRLAGHPRSSTSRGPMSNVEGSPLGVAEDSGFHSDMSTAALVSSIPPVVGPDAAIVVARTLAKPALTLPPMGKAYPLSGPGTSVYPFILELPIPFWCIRFCQAFNPF
ncbi:hypothetical protein H696_03617 [Fonticula alba]|uniref:BD-FAE-like domain-containing protein n=1 Tax=Fonticula alba TaxID=691883 RepID=A0A058Z9G2_FONAL|nr:hypothetical protein H696_03617 [Fonticula alba]KCV70157.1 hypothetical protein H696_03617 [Fonticula alba]|eukprot:XP_009495763.1 hypothetical protein H696_03617 [Fonticula alba]